MPIEKELIAASTAPLILSIIGQGESYGYEIIKRVRELSNEDIAWTDGMLYPVLHRLERKGWIRSEWRAAETGRKRRYYFIRKAGVKALGEQREQWLRVHATLNRAWEALPCSS